MTVVKTVATHEVVQAVYPRPVTERDEVGMAVGRAIDDTLSRFSFEYSRGRRPTLSAMYRSATETLARELSDADVTLPAPEREREQTKIYGVLQAFRGSELMGLSRPRSRMILINERVGVYAQPDYWDGRARFYEMKSYHAVPTPPDVRLQVQLFQAAFPNFRACVAWFDRHAVPVTSAIEPFPPLAPAETADILSRAYALGLEKGVEKVLEYVDTPIVRYQLAELLGSSGEPTSP